MEQQAALNLSYTAVTAPVDGTVGARSLRVGQFVQAGTQLMAVVPLDAVYVVANFKETQLTHVRNGQPVELTDRQLPLDQAARAMSTVSSPASGLEFALLPPDNATGNFTKIVQRVPVKIVLDDHNLKGLLRPGMSAEPTVDTKSAAVAEREAEKRLASRGAKPPQLNGAECPPSHPTRTAMTTLHTQSMPFPPTKAANRGAGDAAVSAKTWIAVVGATLGAFMAVLNIQIVNASLADIQGAIGAGIDDGGWISTSYLIAEIVVIPLSGWLAQVFSIRIYLLTNACSSWCSRRPARSRKTCRR